MNVIILVAGSGTRMGRLTKDVNKCMIPIQDGKGSLELILDQLFLSGIGERDVRIATGFQHEEISRKFPKYHCVRTERYEECNNAYTLMRMLNGASGATFVINGDLVFDESICMEMLSMSFFDRDLCMVIDPGRAGAEAMKIRIKQDGSGLATVSKFIPEGLEHGEYIGIMRLSVGGIQQMKSVGKELIQESGNALFWYEDVIQEIINRGGEVNPQFISGLWIEIDTPDDMNMARRMFREHGELRFGSDGPQVAGAELDERG